MALEVIRQPYLGTNTTCAATLPRTPACQRLVRSMSLTRALQAGAGSAVTEQTVWPTDLQTAAGKEWAVTFTGCCRSESQVCTPQGLYRMPDDFVCVIAVLNVNERCIGGPREHNCLQTGELEGCLRQCSPPPRPATILNAA